MELDTEGCFPVGETSDDFACLCVPELDYFVETCTQESSAVIAEADIPHSFGVTHISTKASLVGEDIPDFDGGVMTCGQHEMT